MRLGDSTLYFDCNATTPEAPEVAEACVQAEREGFANPSSLHGPGRRARALLEQARSRVAGLAGCSSDEVIFTGSATEANHVAILSAAEVPAPRRRVVVSAIEHPSVLAACQKLRAMGFKVDEAPVTADGAVDLAAFELLMGDDVGLVSVMAAHNETGVLQPLKAVAAMCRKHGALFHTDAAQAMGKVASPWGSASPDYMTMAAHKMYGPKGIAALVARRAAPLAPVLTGGGQESGRRSSTEAVPLAAGFGVAALLASGGLAEFAKLAELRRTLEEGVLAQAGAVVFGATATRIPNTSFFAIPGLSGMALAKRLDDLKIAAGTGSACHEGGESLPRVLECMGVTLPPGTSPVRISMGRGTTEADVRELSSALMSAVSRGRSDDGR